MNNKLKKIKDQGIFRLFYILTALLIGRLRAITYRIISDNRSVSCAATLEQATFFSGKGKIKLGRSKVGVRQSPYYFSSYCYFEARNPEAQIQIGDGVFINNNATIIADRTTVEIHDGCLIGPGLSVYDSDFHEIDPLNRNSGGHTCLPVVIKSNVFIGSHVTILKGVTIGKNSVIASGSVVTNEIPENVIAGGNPARVIKPIEIAHP